MSRSILVVEDEKEIRDLLVHYLRKEGFSPWAAADVEGGLKIIHSERPDLVLLDILLPGVDGLEFLKWIRADKDTCRIPVILLTAKTEETDKIVGLELGADDYITKPFSPREVVARVKAVFRRYRRVPAATGDEVYDSMGIHMDVARHEVRFEGKPVALTTKEFGILRILFAAEGRVLSREAILEKVWSVDTNVTDRTVDVHVAKLRQKIPALAEAIQTVKDVGYKLRGPFPSAADSPRPPASPAGKLAGMGRLAGEKGRSSKYRPAS